MVTLPAEIFPISMTIHSTNSLSDIFIPKQVALVNLLFPPAQTIHVMQEHFIFHQINSAICCGHVALCCSRKIIQATSCCGCYLAFVYFGLHFYLEYNLGCCMLLLLVYISSAFYFINLDYTAKHYLLLVLYVLVGVFSQLEKKTIEGIMWKLKLIDLSEISKITTLEYLYSGLYVE